MNWYYEDLEDRKFIQSAKSTQQIVDYFNRRDKSRLYSNIEKPNFLPN